MQPTNKKATAPARSIEERIASERTAFLTWKAKVKANPHYAQLATEADRELEASMQVKH